ncbi:hypothetical protein EYF80_013707 [Liparis tanakae]|uniref:Uncharacterized protein n=1 Tax=Liparis tanakae TaxID=230148 RepID=A0A4Z2IDY2_9TELE|nr:hypothetical protein EYF80_013707 [Liparis tanakae]
MVTDEGYNHRVLQITFTWTSQQLCGFSSGDDGQRVREHFSYKKTRPDGVFTNGALAVSPGVHTITLEQS